MRPIPLISAGQVAVFSDLLDDAGLSADRHLESARLSPKFREDPAGFLPGRSVLAFLGGVSHSQGLNDLCLRLASQSELSRAGWARPLAHAVTLGDAIRAMCTSYVREIPMIRLGLDVGDPVAWFWRRRVAEAARWEGNEPAEQYMISNMLKVIRTAAGPDWLPERLKLESPPSGWGAATTAFPGVRIEYGQPLLAVAIPIPLLSLPACVGIPPDCRSNSEPAPADFQGSLREVLRPWIATPLLSQDLAGEILGMSPRSLRRRLGEEGVTWRDIVEDLTFAHATSRLRDGRASVREIAEELGYSDTAHFTRFFRRRAGVPPSAYRAQVERATELVRRPQASGA